MIGVQSFKWSLEHDRWQGRVGTIKGAHAQIAKDLGDTAINIYIAPNTPHKVTPEHEQMMFEWFGKWL